MRRSDRPEADQRAERFRELADVSPIRMRRELGLEAFHAKEKELLAEFLELYADVETC
jgi:hypothetical protein